MQLQFYPYIDYEVETVKMVNSQLLGLCLFLAITLTFLVATGELRDPEDGGRGSTDNSYMESAEYMGSSTCKGCHAAKYADWETTLHTKKIRPVSEDIVLADFTEDQVLAQEGVEAVTMELYHDPGTDLYTVNLSGNNYTVDWVLGAGAWRQLFMVDIESGSYILPLQWNTATEEWVPYHLDEWYDAQGDPLAIDWGFGGQPIKQTALDRSWQKNCAGCHTTGYTPQQNGNGEWISEEGDNMAEYNIGCEACHGPGSAHVAASTPEDRRANIWRTGDSNVCSQCHSRGTSKDGQHDYPVGMYPGDDIEDHLDLSTEDFWAGTNISKKHHQQYMDWSTSGHSRPTPEAARQVACFNCHTPEGAEALFNGEKLTEIPEEVSWAVTCAACHDAHGTDNKHDLRAEKNELCITCHNSEGALPGETPHHPMYEMLTGQGGAGIIGDLRMGGAVTCSDCHMPKVAESAIEYDIASHTFWIIEPQQTIEQGIPNACTSSCHNGQGSGNPLTDETAQLVIETWHNEIDTMTAFVSDNLTKAQFTLDQAQSEGTDPALVTQAEEIYSIARFNYELVTNEGSRGVHNFEYARALLYDSFLKSLEIRDMLRVDLPDNPPPLAVAGDTMVAGVGTVLSFDGSESYSPEATTLNFQWDFGDQSSDTGVSVQHNFNALGAYSVTLTVTDEDTQTDSDTIMVYVISNSSDLAELGSIEGDLEALEALAQALGVDVQTLQAAIADLEEQDDELARDLDERATKDDLSSKVGPMAFFLVLVLSVILIAGSYMASQQELAKLRAELGPPRGTYGTVGEPSPEEKTDGASDQDPNIK